MFIMLFLLFPICMHKHNFILRLRTAGSFLKLPSYRSVMFYASYLQREGTLVSLFEVFFELSIKIKSSIKKLRTLTVNI